MLCGTRAISARSVGICDGVPSTARSSFSYFCSKHRLWVLIEAALTSTHNLCFEQKYEKYQNFLSENFHFLVVKFSVYLNRRVFIMIKIAGYLEFIYLHQLEIKVK